MSARRKNSKALKKLRAMGLSIDGNFLIPQESAMRFPITNMGNWPKTFDKYVTVIHDSKYIKVDPMLARRLSKQVGTR